MSRNTTKPGTHRRTLKMPLWTAILSVIIVAIICITATIVLMQSYHKSVDAELASEVGSLEAVTENVIPTDSSYTGLEDSPHWQLRTFGWLLQRPVTAADISELNDRDRALLANAILAMGGYTFQNEATHKLFSDFDWYHPWAKTREMLSLTPVARKNYDFIIDYK